MLELELRYSGKAPYSGHAGPSFGLLLAAHVDLCMSLLPMNPKSHPGPRYESTSNFSFVAFRESGPSSIS